MKREIKKYLIFVLIVIAMTMISFIKPNKVEASTNCSADEAIAWCNSKINQSLGNGQCTAFVVSYVYQICPNCTFGIPGNACDVIYQKLPDGWQYIQGAQPQKGDILVYGPTSSNSAGHVAVYESDNVTYHQNFHGHYVERIELNFRNVLNSYMGVIRPDFIDNRDKENPVIKEAFIDMSSITSTGFKVNVKATDNDKIDKIEIGVWTELESQSDIQWIKCNHNSTTGYDVANVRKSAFNNKTCMYRIHVYAFDSSGNKACKVLADIPMGSTVANLGDSFKARIILSSNNNYAIGAGGSSLDSRVQLQNKSISDNKQLWEFKRNSNGSYHIKNVGTGLYIDISGASEAENVNAQLYTSNDTKAQQFYIMNYNGHYRLVSGCTPDWKAIDIPGGDIHNGADLWQHSAEKMNNGSQTFSIEKASDYTLGDVDNNGKIDVNDAIMVLQHVAKKITLTDSQLLAADVDKQKGAQTTTTTINVNDAIKILQKVAKKIDKFE